LTAPSLSAKATAQFTVLHPPQMPPSAPLTKRRSPKARTYLELAGVARHRDGRGFCATRQALRARTQAPSG
jgi:hypothetical protein